jgi:hypothetical protein
VSHESTLERDVPHRVDALRHKVNLFVIS